MGFFFGFEMFHLCSHEQQFIGHNFLFNLAKKLWKANHRKSLKSKTCLICEEDRASILYQPCSHCAVCNKCHQRLWKKESDHKCMMCSKCIKSVVKLKFC